MLYILNKTKKVIVVKSYGRLTMRLFPGYNRVSNDAQDYFTTPVAAAYLDECLEVTKDIPEGREVEAGASFDKNKALNKAQRVINIQKPENVASPEVLALREKVADLETKLKKRK